MKDYYTINYLISKIKLYFFQKKNPNDPWLTSESIKILRQLILKTDIGFEFGSGRSTKWFASRCKYLYSVEHNQTWFDIVSNQLKNYGNVEYYYKEINVEKPEQSDYLVKMKQLENESLDFILNDGRIRGEVAVISIDKLKYGGLFIIDNAERYLVNSFDVPESIGDDSSKMKTEWLDFYHQTINWRRIWTSDGITSTLIMFKS